MKYRTCKIGQKKKIHLIEFIVSSQSKSICFGYSCCGYVIMSRDVNNQQNSILVGCVLPAYKPYMPCWPPLDVSTSGAGSSSEQV